MNMLIVFLQDYTPKAAGGSNAALGKPSSTAMSLLPTADPYEHPDGFAAAVAPVVPGDAIATAVEMRPVVGAAPLTLPPTPSQMPAAHVGTGNSAGTVVDQAGHASEGLQAHDAAVPAAAAAGLTQQQQRAVSHKMVDGFINGAMAMLCRSG